MKRWSTCIALAGILILAAALRIYHLGYTSAWIDEIASLQLSSGQSIGKFDCPTDQIVQPAPQPTQMRASRPVADIWRALKDDTHPPLYSLILRVWRMLFGDADAATRSLSLFCSLLAIYFLFDSVRLLTDVSAAFWAATMMAIASSQIEYAQETRGYMMLVLFSVAAVNAAVRIEKLGPDVARFASLTLALLGAMTTHYYGAAVFAAIFIHALLSFKLRPSRTILLASTTALALFLLTTGPLLWSQRLNFHHNMTWIDDDSPGLVLRTLQRFCALPLRFCLGSISKISPLNASSILILILPLLLMRRQPGLRIWWLLAICAMLLPLSADLANRSRSLELLRYSLPASPAIFALAASLFNDRKGMIRHVIPAAMLLACMAGLLDAYERPQKPDWRGLAADFDRVAAADEPIIAYYLDDRFWYSATMYAALAHNLPNSHRPLVVLTGPPSESLRKALAAYPHCWLLDSDEIPSVSPDFVPEASPTTVSRPYVGRITPVTLPTINHVAN